MARKNKSVCEVWELTRMERTDQASERDTNQHLLIASGVLGERSICGEGERRRGGGRKDNHPRHSSKNTKECHILRQLSVSVQATQGNEPRWRRGLMLGLVQLLTVNECSGTPFPNVRTSQSVHPSITQPLCM